LDGARSVDQNAHLAADVSRDLGQLAGELVRDEPVLREPPFSESFERLDLAGLQSRGIAVDLDGVAPGLNPMADSRARRFANRSR
jgi:hypothetical protein